MARFKIISFLSDTPPTLFRNNGIHGELLELRYCHASDCPLAKVYFFSLFFTFAVGFLGSFGSPGVVRGLGLPPSADLTSLLSQSAWMIKHLFLKALTWSSSINLHHGQKLAIII